MSRTLTFAAALAARPLSATVLHMVAAALRGAGDIVHRAAVRVGTAEDALATTPPIETVEFHEGALYVNGVLVAILPGVRRL